MAQNHQSNMVSNQYAQPPVMQQTPQPLGFQPHPNPKSVQPPAFNAQNSTIPPPIISPNQVQTLVVKSNGPSSSATAKNGSGSTVKVAKNENNSVDKPVEDSKTKLKYLALKAENDSSLQVFSIDFRKSKR